MLLEGLHVPVATPFYPDGKVYLRKLEHNVARYSMTPAEGLAILGPMGEAEMLTDSETREVLAAAIGAAAEQKVMWAGIGKPSVLTTLELAAYAADLGYDVALVRVPEVEAVAYFAALADSCSLPIAIWDEKGQLSASEIASLARHKSIIGVVANSATSELVAATSAIAKREVIVTPIFAAATGRMLSVKSEGPASFVTLGSLSDGGTALAVAPSKPAIKTRTKMVAFHVISTASGEMVEALRGGASGTMTPFTTSAPQASYEVYAAWKDGDPKLAEEKQARIAAPVKKIVDELGIAGVKYASELTGYYGGKPRLPRVPPTAAEKAAVEQQMDGIRS